MGNGCRPFGTHGFRLISNINFFPSFRSRAFFLCVSMKDIQDLQSFEVFKNLKYSPSNNPFISFVSQSFFVLQLSFSSHLNLIIYILTLYLYLYFFRIILYLKYYINFNIYFFYSYNFNILIFFIIFLIIFLYCFQYY